MLLKPVKNLLVLVFVASISWLVVLSAYYRKGIKVFLLIALVSRLLIALIDEREKILLVVKQYFSRVYLSFVLFGLSVLLSTVFSRYHAYSFPIFFERYVYYFIVFEIGRSLFLSQGIDYVLARFTSLSIEDLVKYIFITAALFMGIGGFVSYISFLPERLFSVFGREIEFYMMPLYVVYFIPVVYSLIFKPGALIQFTLSVFAFISLLVCLILTGTRVAWVSGIIALLFATFLINKKYLKYFFVCCFLFLILVFLTAPSRMHDILSCFIRKDIMLAAFNIFRDNLLLGAGPGTYEILVSKYVTYAKDYNAFLHAHSMYLEILSELGILGLISFGSIFINFYFYNAKRILPANGNNYLFIGLLSSVAGALVFGLFGSIILVGFHDAPMFWLIFGLTFGFYQRLKKKAAA